MKAQDDSFGATVRRLREEQKIGLRKFAQLFGMSPTYLSKVERDASRKRRVAEKFQFYDRGMKPWLVSDDNALNLFFYYDAY